ncbi:hypothetical protein FB451DRAFT_1228159 [Mycena latifolia]|nr:hypothetical protein FB451DRAFT_1228159 [Mycena latifolia]
MLDGFGVTTVPNGPSHCMLAVYDRKTGVMYPLRSLACSMLFAGGGMAAVTAPLGAIPYAIQGAAQAPTGLRLPSALTLMRFGAMTKAVPLGAAAAMIPLGSYTAERCGLHTDSLPHLGIQAGFASVAFFSTYKRWMPTKHFLAAEQGSTVLSFTALLGLVVWRLVLRNVGELCGSAAV